MKTFFDSRGTETCFPAGRKKQAPQKCSQAAWPQRAGEPGGCSGTRVLTGELGRQLNFTGTDLQCDLGQIKKHSAVPWETPKKHHQYYCIGLSRLACPAPLKEGWIIVVMVPPVLKLAQLPLQSPTLQTLLQTTPQSVWEVGTKTVVYLQGKFWR